jgi:hypothetical protein
MTITGVKLPWEPAWPEGRFWRVAAFHLCLSGGECIEDACADGWKDVAEQRADRLLSGGRGPVLRDCLDERIGGGEHAAGIGMPAGAVSLTRTGFGWHGDAGTSMALCCDDAPPVPGGHAAEHVGVAGDEPALEVKVVSSLGRVALTVPLPVIPEV